VALVTAVMRIAREELAENGWKIGMIEEAL